MPFALTPERERELAEILDALPDEDGGAAFPLLHLCQEQNGWVSEDVISFVAHRLDLAARARRRASSRSTRSSTSSRSASTRSGCAARCPARSAAPTTSSRHCEKRLGIHAGETTKDGKVTLRTAECLAALRHRADDAGRQGLPREPHARRRSTQILDAPPEELSDAPMLKQTNYLTKVYGVPERLDARRLRARARRLPGRAQSAHDDDARAGRRRGEEGEHPRPRRRRLPDGREVELHEAPPDEARVPRRSTPTRASRARSKTARIMEQNPHSRASRAASSAATRIGAHVAYIYVRDELHLSKERLWGAIDEAQAKGYLGKTPVRQGLRRRGRTSTPAPARTSAAKRRRSSTRSKASAASRASSRRSPRRPARSAARRP